MPDDTDEDAVDTESLPTVETNDDGSVIVPDDYRERGYEYRNHGFGYYLPEAADPDVVSYTIMASPRYDDVPAGCVRFVGDDEDDGTLYRVEDVDPTENPHVDTDG